MAAELLSFQCPLATPGRLLVENDEAMYVPPPLAIQVLKPGGTKLGTLFRYWGARESERRSGKGTLSHLAEHADAVSSALVQVSREGRVVDNGLVDVHAGRSVCRLDVVVVAARHQL